LDTVITQIEAIVNKSFELEALKDCFLVDIEHSSSKVRIFIDTDEGVGFDKCRTLSREVEAVLDENQLLGEKYTLEVSSPGISRPLKFLRQYPRNIGRDIECKMKDGEVIKGKLEDVKGDVLHIASAGKKKKEIINHEITFDALESAKILISFGKKKMKK